jgi:ribosomal protein S18 acetylase RimI-like enzyme
VTAASRPGVTVRRVVASEWTRLRELRLQALATDPLAFGSTVDEEARFDETRWRERAERGATAEGSGQWVAESPSGEPIGMIVVAEAEGAVNIFSMWVAPSHRGQGIGARLLETGLAWARGRFPGRPVRLDVNPKQAPAVRLYESHGFHPTGRSRPLGHTAGESVREMLRPPD